MDKVIQSVSQEFEQLFESLTIDQWVTFHLLFEAFLRTQRKSDAMGVNNPANPIIEEYITKATEVIRDFTQKTPYSKLNTDLCSANGCAPEVLSHILFDPQSIDTLELSALKALVIKHLLVYCIEVFGENSFKNRFTDVVFPEDGYGYAFSAKALIILEGLLARVCEDSKERIKAYQARMSTSLSQNNLVDDRSNNDKNGISSEDNAQIQVDSNSSITLDEEADNVCHLVKEEKEEKEVCDSQMEEIISSEVVDSVKEEISYLVQEEIPNKDAKNSIDQEIIEETNSDHSDALEEESVEEVGDGSEVEKDDESESNLEEDNEEESDEDFEEDIEESEADGNEFESIEESWEDVRVLLDIMPVEDVLAAHIINLKICQDYLDSKLYSKFQKNLAKAVSTYNGFSNQKQKEFALRNASDSFVKLKDKVIENFDKMSDLERHLAPYKGWFSLATDYCLTFVDEEFDDKMAKRLLKDLSIVKDDIRFTPDIGEYADSFCKVGKNAYDKMHIGEDYEYDNDEDEDAEDDFVDPFKEMTELCMAHVTNTLNRLDLEQDILTHALSLNLMLGNYPNDLISDYLLQVNNLISFYLSKEDKSMMDKARKDADEQYLKISKRITQLINTLDSIDPDPVIERYADFDIAAAQFLNTVNSFKKNTILSALKELTFDADKGIYTGKKVEKLAADYLERAQE